MKSLKHKESPGENAIYRIEVEGVSILHLGIRVIPSPTSNSISYVAK